MVRFFLLFLISLTSAMEEEAERIGVCRIMETGQLNPLN